MVRQYSSRPILRQTPSSLRHIPLRVDVAGWLGKFNLIRSTVARVVIDRFREAQQLALQVLVLVLACDGEMVDAAAIVAGLKAPVTGQMTVWDSASPIGVRVSQGGSKTSVVMIGSGKRRKIGRVGILTLAEARAERPRTSLERHSHES